MMRVNFNPQELFRDLATLVNRCAIPPAERIEDLSGHREGLFFFPAAQFAGTIGNHPVVPVEVPGGHIGDDDICGVEGEVAVRIGGLDVVAVGVAEHAVHGGFDVECLLSGSSLSNARKGTKGGKLDKGEWDVGCGGRYVRRIRLVTPFLRKNELDSSIAAASTG